MYFTLNMMIAAIAILVDWRYFTSGCYFIVRAFLLLFAVYERLICTSISMINGLFLISTFYPQILAIFIGINNSGNIQYLPLCDLHCLEYYPQSWSLWMVFTTNVESVGKVFRVWVLSFDLPLKRIAAYYLYTILLDLFVLFILSK